MAEANTDVPKTNGHVSPPLGSTATVQQPQTVISNPTVPATSNQDSGHGRRPRDTRLIHLLLSSLGCSAYQERVPLQLLDFAYRHSSSVLSDALNLSSDPNISQQTRARDAPLGGLHRDDGQVSANAVQLAIQSRLQYQFGGGNSSGLSKEFLMEISQTRNRVALPRVLQNEWGVRLPSERFVLTGVPWGLKGEWNLETEVEEPDDKTQSNIEKNEDVVMKDECEEEGNEGGGTIEDLYGVNIDADMDKDE